MNIESTVARAFLGLSGWRPEGVQPTAPKYVLIAAPHTSNWDFPYTLALAWLLDVRMQWMGKHTLFRPPYGWAMRRLGGIPIRRHERTNMVERAAELLSQSDELALLVPAEGTRSRTEYWKSGFLHIARTANVPIVLGYLDFARRRGGFGPAISAQGDAREVMDRIRAFYAGKLGKHPKLFGPVRLRDEDEALQAVVSSAA